MQQSWASRNKPAHLCEIDLGKGARKIQRGKNNLFKHLVLGFQDIHMQKDKKLNITHHTKNHHKIMTDLNARYKTLETRYGSINL